MKKVMAMLLVLVMVLSFAACGQSADHRELTTLRVAYMPNWGALWALATTDHKGYFEEEGLKIEYVRVDEGHTEVSALDTAGIDLAYIGQAPHQFCSTGDAQVVLLQHIGQADSIIGLSGVEKLEDLKGKKVGYSAGTASETLLITALASVGMTMNDIEAVSLESSNLTAAAVSGNLDAISAWNPFVATILDENQHAVEICRNVDFPELASPCSWVTSPSWAKDNKDILVRFVRAMYKGMNYAADAGFDNDLANEVAGYVADVMDTDPSAILDQRFDGAWLTGDKILVGVENGRILQYYGMQQDAFITNGVLKQDEVLAPEEFVLTDVMQEAGQQ